MASKTPPENEPENEQKMTMTEIGRRGGLSTRRRHGKKYLRELGRKAGLAPHATRGRRGHPAEPKPPKEEITVVEGGRRGGQVVFEKYGREFYSRIGRKGGTSPTEEEGAEKGPGEKMRVKVKK